MIEQIIICLSITLLGWLELGILYIKNKKEIVKKLLIILLVTTSIGLAFVTALYVKIIISVC